MRKVMKLEGEICANCAAKVQAAIEKLPGVNDVSVNAMTYKFTLDAEEERYNGILEQSIKIFADIEPDCDVIA
ncbi:MAG: heavy-metal-associated domain-containing protein [Eggerthellaceae bacterium]|nr:heavy-metal-associated domain-containing protein [Eggerthellaceae bacterium]